MAVRAAPDVVDGHIAISQNDNDDDDDCDDNGTGSGTTTRTLADNASNSALTTALHYTFRLTLQLAKSRSISVQNSLGMLSGDRDSLQLRCLIFQNDSNCHLYCLPYFDFLRALYLH